MKKLFSAGLEIIGWVGFLSPITWVFPEITFNQIPLSARIILSLVGILLILLTKTELFHFIKRKIIYYWACRKQIRIGICIEGDVQSAEIVKYCNEKIKSISTKIKFEVKKIKENDYRKAGKLVESSNLDLVVWTTKANNSSGKISINFTYKNTTDNLIAKIIHSQMSSLVSIEKMFNLNKDTIKVDLDLERDNIINFSLFIVAICGSIFRGINVGIPIFEKLHERVRGENTLLKKAVTKQLAGSYLVMGAELLRKGKYPVSLEILEKAHDLDCRDRDILSSVALARFQNGDFEGAEKISNELLQNYTGYPIAHLDGAFFRIRRKKYTSALKHYSLFAKTKPQHSICIDAIEFLSQRLDEEPNELGYLFARGYLKRLLDKNKPEFTKVGKSDYEQDYKAFVNRSTGNTSYAEMNKVAKIHLSELSRAKSKRH